MKKRIALAPILTAALLLSACGSETPTPAATPTEATTTQTEATPTPTPTETKTPTPTFEVVVIEATVPAGHTVVLPYMPPNGESVVYTYSAGRDLIEEDLAAAAELPLYRTDDEFPVGAVLSVKAGVEGVVEGQIRLVSRDDLTDVTDPVAEFVLAVAE